MNVRAVGVVLIAALLAGCTAGPSHRGPASLDLPGRDGSDTPRATSTSADPRDPLQGLNRGMWFVNYDVLEPYIARPVVHSYADYVPVPVKMGIENFIENFNEPSSMVNHLLSGDLKGVGTNLGRFALNTTVGLLGIFDVAKHIGLERNKLELGTLLGRADIGEGAYIMMPVLGPTTTRELVGDTIDTLYFPFSLLTLPLKLVHHGVDGINARSKLIEQEQIIDNALDPYALTKDFYLQFNQRKVDAGQTGTKSVPAAAEASVPADNDEQLDEYLNEIDKQ